MTSDADLSRVLAQETGALLLRVREEFGVIDRDDRERLRDLRDTADRSAHVLIASRLAAERPADVLMSEEGDDDPARLSAARVWIVDPLDGTWEYGQARDDFAVHVALWTRDAHGGSLTAATVDLPAKGLTFAQDDGAVAPVALPTDRPVRVVVSRTRRPEAVDAVVDALPAALGADVEVDPVGSVGAKVGELLAGRAELYLHDSGFHDWDLAAPLAIAQARGFWCSTPDGAPFAFNGTSLVQPGVVIAAPAVADEVRRVLGL